jgi:serine O-acetyltransferase
LVRKRRSQDIASRLVESYRAVQVSPGRGYDLPSQRELEKAFESIRDLLYPGLTGHRVRTSRAAVAQKLATLEQRLARQIWRGVCHRDALLGGGSPIDATAARRLADDMARRLLARLPELREKLAKDIRAAYDGDPAATGTDEVVFCYPGVYAITAYRVAHALHEIGVPVLPRMLAEHAHARTGIDIHPGATIGDSFFIDHGTGVVIGETTVIGARVRIYQGVTLGALGVPDAQTLRGRKRHPTLEDDVIIYANATILGGETVIGRRAIVGGNTWVTKSVPPGGRIVSTQTMADGNGPAARSGYGK